MFTLPLTAELIAGFAAVTVHASRDTMTPVLTHVRIDHRHITATQRYTIGQYEHTTLAESIERHGEAGPADPDAFVLIPREIAEWVGKHKFTRGQTLTLTATAATIQWEGTDAVIEARSFPECTQGFPPVARLIPERTDAPADILPTHLGADMLTLICKSAQSIGRAARAKNYPIRFQFASVTDRKLSPVLATVGERMTMLIQQSLPSR